MSEQPHGTAGDCGISELFRLGSLIAGHRLEERIGRACMAVVFSAYDSRLDRQVALKILAPVLASDDSFRQRHATRIVARAWIREIWACWHTGIPYDPETHRAQQRLIA